MKLMKLVNETRVRYGIIAVLCGRSRVRSDLDTSWDVRCI